MSKKLYTFEELEQELINILYEKKFVSFHIEKGIINSNTQLLKDLAIDSIMLLEYLTAIESKLDLNIDYEDLDMDVFNDIRSLALYFNQYQSKQNVG